MKANKAPDFPEKVYIPRDPEYPQSPNLWWEREPSENNIEYTRTDAFITKACDAYCKVCGHYAHTVPTHICRHDCRYFSDFKNYMKGE